LESKKPKGFGIDTSRFEEIIGMELKKDMKQCNFLNELDFQKGDRYIRSH
jgi:N-acetylneuraminate synthase